MNNNRRQVSFCELLICLCSNLSWNLKARFLDECLQTTLRACQDLGLCEMINL